MAHIRIRYATRGGHVHCGVWSTEGGAETTHGRNGELVFRPAEFETFRDAMLIGGVPVGTVEFVEESGREQPRRLDLQVACPQCRAVGTLVEAFYDEPQVFVWTAGTFTDPARLTGWQMSCGHVVKGSEYHLFIDQGLTSPAISIPNLTSRVTPAQPDFPCQPVPPHPSSTHQSEPTRPDYSSPPDPSQPDKPCPPVPASPHPDYPNRAVPRRLPVSSPTNPPRAFSTSQPSAAQPAPSPTTRLVPPPATPTTPREPNQPAPDYPPPALPSRLPIPDLVHPATSTTRTGPPLFHPTLADSPGHTTHLPDDPFRTAPHPLGDRLIARRNR